ncbi:hypothetical protein LEN26_011659 [Aphanomyces euteiches]|nr:hypothetical protein LEN26_011659 [Aphanomyces euteiches]KAH9127984.1 hypothetical protein AeMF1_001789 [Aphanomyces euteiches]KAH9190609.1 hypothetical protein AeNC1_007406 [Aphanomyces euteiches]
MSLSINGVQVGGKLLEMASDMKMTIVVLAIIVYIGYRSTVASTKPAKSIEEALVECERLQRELLEEEDRQLPLIVPATTTPKQSILRRKKKKAKRKENNPDEEYSSNEQDHHEDVADDMPITQEKEATVVEEEPDQVRPAIEIPQQQEQQTRDTAPVLIVAAKSPNVDIIVAKKKTKKKSPRSPMKDFLVSAPEIDWSDVPLPTKSSPGSTASTSSSSSSKARRSLSPVKPPAPVSEELLMSLSPAAKPLKLARSQSSVADGRSWREVLGAPPAPPSLSKTASLGVPPVPINPPLPKDPPSLTPSELDQIVQQMYVPRLMSFSTLTLSSSAFYFSEANLQRDLFLRNRMDVQGFVYVSVVLNFNRVKAMTQFQKTSLDMLQLIQSLEQSPTLDVYVKRRSDGSVDPEFARLAKVRPAMNWARWLPAKPLPSSHPFEAHAWRAASTFAQTA